VPATAWWYACDVTDPTNLAHFYIASFSSRKTRAAHYLDVAAPGVRVLGPYQINSGQLSYYFLNGTSMASPHVAGIVALITQKKSSLTAGEAETILQDTALPIPGVPSEVQGSGLAHADRALATTN